MHRSLNMFTLIAMGTGAAYLCSVAAVAMPGMFPEVVSRAWWRTGVVLAEAAAVITVLVLLGQVLELEGEGQDGKAIRACWGWLPRRRAGIAADGTGDGCPFEQSDCRRPDCEGEAGRRIPVDRVVEDGLARWMSRW